MNMAVQGQLIASQSVDSQLCIHREIAIEDILELLRRPMSLFFMDGGCDASIDKVLFADSPSCETFTGQNGYGSSLDEAINQFCENISGKVMLVDDGDFGGRRFQLPAKVYLRRSCITTSSAE